MICPNCLQENNKITKRYTREEFITKYKQDPNLQPNTDVDAIIKTDIFLYECLACETKFLKPAPIDNDGVDMPIPIGEDFYTRLTSD
jgi:hypothetical protein